MYPPFWNIVFSCWMVYHLDACLLCCYLSIVLYILTLSKSIDNNTILFAALPVILAKKRLFNSRLKWTKPVVFEAKGRNLWWLLWRSVPKRAKMIALLIPLFYRGSLRRKFFNCWGETTSLMSFHDADCWSSILLWDGEEDENWWVDRSRTDFRLSWFSFRFECIVVSRVDFVTFCLQKCATFYVRVARMAHVSDKSPPGAILQ